MDKTNKIIQTLGTWTLAFLNKTWQFLVKISTHLDDHTMNLVNRVGKYSYWRTVGLPLGVVALIIFANLAVYVPSIIVTIVMLILLFIPGIAVASKVALWIWRKWHKAIPTLWFWLMAVVLDIVTLAVVFAAVIVAIFVFIAILLIGTMLGFTSAEKEQRYYDNNQEIYRLENEITRLKNNM
ncbi:MAG: hypothetical protein LBT37_05885 [Lactobacillaceae bacterium]|jgi:uncharacterized membrane protein YhaH (DUF805 family)|nr:hypothetical protein [Lactobacillaceae bacterium]